MWLANLFINTLPYFIVEMRHLTGVNVFRIMWEFRNRDSLSTESQSKNQKLGINRVFVALMKLDQDLSHKENQSLYPEIRH